MGFLNGYKIGTLLLNTSFVLDQFLEIFLFSFIIVFFYILQLFDDEYTLHLFALISKNIVSLQKVTGNTPINSKEPWSLTTPGE